MVGETVIEPSVAPGQVAVFVVALPVGAGPSVTLIFATVNTQPVTVCVPVTIYETGASAVKIPVVLVAPPGVST